MLMWKVLKAGGPRNFKGCARRSMGGILTRQSIGIVLRCTHVPAVKAHSSLVCSAFASY